MSEVNEKIAKLTGYSPEQVAIVKNVVAKDTTDTELAYFLSVCKSVELNPFIKEIWCYKDNKGNLLVFAGRDGFLSKAQRSKYWNGITSFVVSKNDVFEMSINDGNVRIDHKPNFADPGEIIGAYAISKPKGAEYPTIEYVKFATYNKGWNVWKSHPSDMIKKVAETHCLKKAYGISGIQSEYDFDTSSGVAIPIDEFGSEPITAEQIASLQEWIDEIDKFDKARFLKYVEAESLESIKQKNFSKALRELERKAKGE